MAKRKHNSLSRREWDRERDRQRPSRITSQETCTHWALKNQIIIKSQINCWLCGAAGEGEGWGRATLVKQSPQKVFVPPLGQVATTTTTTTATGSRCAAAADATCCLPVLPLLPAASVAPPAACCQCCLPRLSHHQHFAVVNRCEAAT